ncbi:DNA (cytosine-5-)-methyltransferase [Haloplasma contractile]|uniref:DNA (cytosine-5-)-methyltransferase n=1 Tax=Haloplasma contractile SSD-17B TaxID=1033810 RepID=U2E9V3_9MOLU|nr:DNA (cytosine-5-)-methyltransferase [Haloplasma contractile]ERJ11908.1 DNA -methyltransferase protein [Haloplasma contractile SSD-17B]
MKKTMIELFAGVGGFRIGLEANGFETVWANQWEPSTKMQHAYEVYTANFGEENASNVDINEVNKEKIPDHTLLVGGFPCQDYSVARTKAQGIQGKKGVLWWNISEILKEKRPKFVLLENVDRLIKSPSDQRGRDFGIMLRSFLDYGYSIEWRVINAAEYGFAQRRRRVFMFAAHESTTYYKSIQEKNHNDILFRDGFFADQFKIDSDYESKKKVVNISISPNMYADLVEVSDNFKSKFHNTGFMINGKVTSIDTKPVEHEIYPLRKILEKSVNENLYIDKNEKKLDRFKYMKGSKREKRVDKNGYEYYYSEGGMSFPDPLDRPARTILTSESSVNRSTHVVEDPETKRLRLLSPVECERLNGFPDDWTNPKNCNITITERKRYFFMGNALVVSLVKKMGITLNNIIDNEEYEENFTILSKDDETSDEKVG